MNEVFGIVVTWVATVLALVVLLLMALSEVMPDMLDRLSNRE